MKALPIEDSRATLLRAAKKGDFANCADVFFLEQAAIDFSASVLCDRAKKATDAALLTGETYDHSREAVAIKELISALRDRKK